VSVIFSVSHKTALAASDISEVHKHVFDRHVLPVTSFVSVNNVLLYVSILPVRSECLSPFQHFGFYHIPSPVHSTKGSLEEHR
jgi:hypothetical protein